MPIETVLDHLAVAAETQTDLWGRYAGDLSGSWVASGAAPGFISSQLEFGGGMKIETLSPHEPEQFDFLRRFLDRNGAGPHHLTFKVQDLAGALVEVEDAGYHPVGVNLDDDQWKEAFLHPKDAPGVVVQLAQAASEWSTEAPAELPAARTAAPATLLHVAHAVRRMEDGLALFRDLLGGHEVDDGVDAGAAWRDLIWSGGGRIRLLAAGDRPDLDAWVGERAGRIHHVAFACAEPEEIADVVPGIGGVHEVPPAANLGTRLHLVLAANPA